MKRTPTLASLIVLLCFGFHPAGLCSAQQDAAGEWVEQADVAPAPLELAAELNAPVSVEDAYPLPVGTNELEFRLECQAQRRRPRNEYHTRVQLSRGVCQRTELRLAWPMEFGQGRIDGNGDLELSVQHQLWGQAAWLPALAVEGGLRVPTGPGSSGVDACGRLLLTHALGQHRLHLVGTLRSVNGNTERRDGGLDWEAAFGWDYPLLANTRVIADYVHRQADRRENRLELALQHRLSERHTLAAGLGVALDRLGHDPSVSLGLAYTLAF